MDLCICRSKSTNFWTVNGTVPNTKLPICSWCLYCLMEKMVMCMHWMERRLAFRKLWITLMDQNVQHCVKNQSYFSFKHARAVSLVHCAVYATLAFGAKAGLAFCWYTLPLQSPSFSKRKLYSFCIFLKNTILSEIKWLMLHYAFSRNFWYIWHSSIYALPFWAFIRTGHKVLNSWSKCIQSEGPVLICLYLLQKTVFCMVNHSTAYWYSENYCEGGVGNIGCCRGHNKGIS